MRVGHMVLNRQLLHEMNKILSFCACSAFAISSDATSSLERLKSARSQRRKIGGILGNCGVNNDRAIHGYWRHAPAAWAWHGASLSTNNLQWCHSCPGGSETAWCLHICNLYTKLELWFRAFTSSKNSCHCQILQENLIPQRMLKYSSGGTLTLFLFL